MTIGDDGISMDVGSLVVHFNHFRWIGIVIDRHLLVAYDGHATNFAGMKPADVNMRSHSISKTEIKVCDIMYMGLQVSVRLHFDPFRLFPQNIEQDRYVMRSKIPDHIDISTEQTQVQPLCFNTINLTQIATLHQFTQFVHCRAVFEGVPYHQYPLLLLSQFSQLFCLSNIRCQRFLN